MRIATICKVGLCALIAAPGLGVAQGTPETLDEIVVTGSLIRGTPLDTALPVEVYTAEDMEASGSPTALEFAKSLSVAGPMSGEAYYFGGAALTGSVQYNLRGIGADKTLTLFNGRRMHQNTSVIPSGAISRVEILKDGAAVTYGADAVGGVVNFITRNSFEGNQISASYKYVADSDGEYTLNLLGGFGSDNTEVLYAAEWEHRSKLSAMDRSFSNKPYYVNPAPWSALTNMATWYARGNIPAFPPALPANPGPGGTAGANEWGGITGIVPDFNESECRAVGGVYTAAATNTTCSYNYSPFYNLVEDNDIYRLYGQVLTEINEDLNFFLRAGFSRVKTPDITGSPSQPVIRGPAINTGATFQLYVPLTNPHAQEFAERRGFDQTGGFPFTHGFTPVTYRAFAHGGNPIYSDGGAPSDIDNKFWHISTGLDGNLTDDIHFDFGMTYNQSNTSADSPDIILYRVQQALMGFGGPNCNVEDLDPNRLGTQNPAAAGQGDCMWYNPFATNFRGQPEFGLDNPQYGGAGAENPRELINWIYNDRYQENTIWSLTSDFVLSGLAPDEVQLPGGPIGWAAGTQWRTIRQRNTVVDPFYNGSQPCAWPIELGHQVPREQSDPAFNGCTVDEPGPFQFFGTLKPNASEQTRTSIFGELNLPVLDSLQFSLALRHERFGSGLDTTVYKVFGKWDVTDNLSVRGSYGTNYQAPGTDLNPGQITNAVNSYTIAGGAWRGAQTFTRTDIDPEEATVSSFGVIWQSQGVLPDHRLRVIVDYFNIETEDELGFLASANDIAEAVFSIHPDPLAAPGTPVPTNGTALADCSHPLADRITFEGGCIQGTTTAADFSSVRRDFGNGPGQLTAGFDIQANYGFPLYAGMLDISLTATNIRRFRQTATILDGYEIDSGSNRLGKLNFATIANATSKWRTNVSTNYAQGDHNFRFVMNYISGVRDDRGPTRPAGNQPFTGTQYEVTTFGVNGRDWLTGDFHYLYDWQAYNSTVGVSIRNITDKNPPVSRQELGYDPRIGNPLGRTIEASIRYNF
jgi:iron complex outermembrane recepter protein